MIYLVSNNQQLFESNVYKTMSIQESIDEINSWDIVQFDTETTGRDPHICKMLCAQFGNKAKDIQIVVDTFSVPLINYKDILETKLLIGHNIKFDIQFCFKDNIIIRNVWDTMIVEQVTHLGFDNAFFRYGLKDLCSRYLGLDMDKSIRDEIPNRGLDERVIYYAAGDVQPLEDIRNKQIKHCEKFKCLTAATLENKFVPVIAYLEWCGIHLDVDKWKLKMEENEKKKIDAKKHLNSWVVDFCNSDKEVFDFESNKKIKINFIKHKFIEVNIQGDLFAVFDPTPQCKINWDSPKQVIEFMKLLGFKTEVKDKKTGKIRDSVQDKIISKQKGIADDFLKYYLDYKASAKECSTYGQNYIDAINPITGRIHTTFWQLGAASGRMSCGSSHSNEDLAKLKNLDKSRCKYVQLQNLPADDITRSSFTSMPGNLFTSCDYSALESRLGADIYNEPEMLNEFLNGSGDMHSLCAKLVFHEELEGIDVKDVKRLRPDLRKKVKPIEFSQQFGGGPKAVSDALGCSMSEAVKFVRAYANGFKGIARFKAIGSKFVRAHGYINICKYTGHRLYWQDWHKWKEIEETPYELYIREYTKVEREEHEGAAAKWDRLALNVVTQGTGIIILKLAMSIYYKWICENGYFNKILLCDLVHDEACIEYPENLAGVADMKLKEAMEVAASKLCKKLPIPAEPETGLYWIH